MRMAGSGGFGRRDDRRRMRDDGRWMRDDGRWMRDDGAGLLVLHIQGQLLLMWCEEPREMDVEQDGDIS